MASNHRNQEISDPYRRTPSERKEPAKPASYPIYRRTKATYRIGAPYDY